MAKGTFQERMRMAIQEGDTVTIARYKIKDGKAEYVVVLSRPNEEFGGSRGALENGRRLEVNSLTPGVLAKAIEGCSQGIMDAVTTIQAAQE